MNIEAPNQPEWMTTISLDLRDLSECLFMSVYYQMADKPQLYGSCQLKLSDLTPG